MNKQQLRDALVIAENENSVNKCRLEIAVKALYKTITLSNRQTADWNMLTIIWGCASNALTEIARLDAKEGK